MTLSKEKLATLYDEDYVRWIEATLAQLRDRNYDNVDWANLLNELEDMAKRERRSIRNNLTVILVHLLKWEFQPEFRTGSWAGSITEHRSRVLSVLEDSPSLKNYLSEALTWAYPRARQQASAETTLPLKVFPVECPYEIDLILDDSFWTD
ncbi:MAG: DUF29 domain-containing protein [Cyanobacteria bacterium SID2]|nr:DUF29 domain-containing protein [Cyanobacteria bacterium SID2]MBP0003714.1 DUF29 domain-containing protein [Cyanobacteria bacterium SBC]